MFGEAKHILCYREAFKCSNLHLHLDADPWRDSNYKLFFLNMWVCLAIFCLFHHRPFPLLITSGYLQILPGHLPTQCNRSSLVLGLSVPVFITVATLPSCLPLNVSVNVWALRHPRHCNGNRQCCSSSQYSQ